MNGSSLPCPPPGPTPLHKAKAKLPMKMNSTLKVTNKTGIMVWTKMRCFESYYAEIVILKFFYCSFCLHNNLTHPLPPHSLFASPSASSSPPLSPQKKPGLGICKLCEDSYGNGVLWVETPKGPIIYTCVVEKTLWSLCGSPFAFALNQRCQWAEEKGATG